MFQSLQSTNKIAKNVLKFFKKQKQRGRENVGTRNKRKEKYKAHDKIIGDLNTNISILASSAPIKNKTIFRWLFH